MILIASLSGNALQCSSNKVSFPITNCFFMPSCQKLSFWYLCILTPTAPGLHLHRMPCTVTYCLGHSLAHRANCLTQRMQGQGWKGGSPAVFIPCGAGHEGCSFSTRKNECVLVFFQLYSHQFLTLRLQYRYTSCHFKRKGKQAHHWK